MLITALHGEEDIDVYAEYLEYANPEENQCYRYAVMTGSQVVTAISIIVTVVVVEEHETAKVTSSEVIDLRSSGDKSRDRPSS